MSKILAENCWERCRINLSYVRINRTILPKYFKEMCSGNLSHYLTNLMHKICFTISFISCFYMFRAHVLIIRMSKLHYTASGIITLKQVSGLKLLKYNSINMSKWFIDIKSFRSHQGPGVDSASSRNDNQEYFLGIKSGRCVRLTTLPPSCAVVKLSGNRNFEPSGHPMDRGSTVVKALCYKQDGLWFDSSWCLSNFSLT